MFSTLLHVTLGAMSTNSSYPTNGDVEIRLLQPDDHFADDLPSPTPDSDGPRWRRTLVATVDGDVVGVGTLALALATASYFCEINVSAEFQRRRIGTRLFEALRVLPGRPLPILSRAMSSHPARRDFAVQLGGSILVHCPMPRVDPTSETGREWMDLQTTPAGYETVPSANLSVDDVRTAWSSYFVWSHEAFGTVQCEALPIVWEGYSAGLDNDLSHVCVDRASGQIVAFSLVSPNGWEGRTFVVAETVHRNAADGVALLRATVAASLRALSERGVQKVDIEGHSTDANLPLLVQGLPPGPSDPMDIYLLGVSAG